MGAEPYEEAAEAMMSDVGSSVVYASSIDRVIYERSFSRKIC